MHSLGSASVIAEILHQKFEQGVPLSRQLKDWQRMGAALSETTLANWIIKSSDLMSPLIRVDSG
ncbi:IS66 family transposase [Levilactobacillus sp.]|uniref:IS66 family transposase n=1 Tax=Levilactobacillus sp. TaxID=2767919 RepID=UPI00338E913C